MAALVNDIVGDTMRAQTRQALRNVETILKAAGSSLDRVVKVTVPRAAGPLQRDERGLCGLLCGRKASAVDGPLRCRHPRCACCHRGDRARLMSVPGHQDTTTSQREMNSKTLALLADASLNPPNRLFTGRHPRVPRFPVLWTNAL